MRPGIPVLLGSLDPHVGGIDYQPLKLPADIDADDLTREIHRLNADPAVTGIMMHLPLPTHIDAARGVFAHPAQLAFLNGPENFCLRSKRQLTNLVEEQRAAVRFLEHTRPFSESAGEGTP